MKIGANDPCHCGSGLKYKKCCRSKGLHKDAESSSVESKEAEELRWEPFGARVGTRFFSLSETKKLLRNRHKTYLSRVESLLGEEHREAWEEGIAMLEQIPLEEVVCLHGVVSLYSHLLLRLEQQEAALAIRLEQLLRVDHEELWFQYGHLALSWLYGDVDPDEKRTFLERLDKLCEKTNTPIPFLVWVDYVEPLWEEQIDRIAARYRSALTPERWRNYPEPLVAWLPVIHRCLSAVSRWLWSHERKKQATTFVKMINRFPWEQWEGGLPGHELTMLCSMMTHLGLWDNVETLCQRVRPVCLAPAVVLYWLGFVAHERGDAEAASDSFRDALKHTESLDDFLLLEFVRHFLKQQELPEMEQALSLLSDQNSLETLHYRLSYHLLAGEYDLALQMSEDIQELAPDDIGVQVRRWLLLEAMEHDQRLLQEVQPVFEEAPLSVEGRIANAMIGLLDARVGNYDAAMQRLKIVSQDDVLGDGWDGRDLWARVLEERGLALRASGKQEEGLLLLVRALDFHPTEWRYHQLLTALIQEGRYDEASSWWEQAHQTYPDSLQICYARFLIAEHYQDWDTCWGCLESIGLEAFRQYNLLKEGLYLRMRTLVYLDRWWDAFVVCEDNLDDILADDDLRELRRQLIAEVGERFRTLEQKLGQQEQHMSQMEEKHQKLFQSMEKFRHQHDTLQDVLQQKKSLQRQLSKAQRREKTAVERAKSEAVQEHLSAKLERVKQWEKERPDVVSPLSNSMRKILSSAELLWYDLALQTEEDHGPIVLQLARVVEGLVNQRLIDPLVANTVESGGRLSDFPTVAVGRLKDKRNRLSLGDAASLLFSRLEKQEPDGTQSVEVNPQSSPEHRHALEQFWSSEPLQQIDREILKYLQSQLPQELRNLAKIRNRASHAGLPLSRDEAKRVRRWVLGEQRGEGILAKVGTVHRRSE